MFGNLISWIFKIKNYQKFTILLQISLTNLHFVTSTFNSISNSKLQFPSVTSINSNFELQLPTSNFPLTTYNSQFQIHNSQFLVFNSQLKICNQELQINNQKFHICFGQTQIITHYKLHTPTTPHLNFKMAHSKSGSKSEAKKWKNKIE